LLKEFTGVLVHRAEADMVWYTCCASAQGKGEHHAKADQIPCLHCVSPLGTFPESVVIKKAYQ
jgi:hypothetical protein